MSVFNEVSGTNYEDLKFRKSVVSKLGALRAHSIVNVPQTLNLCGAPINLSVTKYLSIISGLSNSVQLSWNPPNTGSCIITSYTIFWCHSNDDYECNDDVSNSYNKATIYA